ncbi:hypothetical protein LUZ63_019783 [Rhynchospora breviuscula]|uniref:Endoglucanase n=1 Tax=Rhynchospora breviuscula TaxID=2022672 RepID=A0A9Q0HJU2_9POAL|nr:hypothetical protein LUZ63_019783 [Rhynchospora breviuscula]
MYSANHWGGPFEIDGDRGHEAEEDDHSGDMDLDRGALSRQLNETQASWLLSPPESKKRDKYIDLGCVVCKRKLFMWVFWSILIAFVVIVVPMIIVKSIPKKKPNPILPDAYENALHKALRFFDAQRSGKLPENNRVLWRGNSGLSDGLDSTDFGLVGGYYDAGDNIKFHFPMAFSMTLLSWTVVEYSEKYKAIGEYDHVRDIIKWGTDYLLLTFNSSAISINKMYSQVGIAKINSTTPDDHYCWMRPEDMDYPRPVQTATSASDLGAEVAAALAAASIVFRDDPAYSKKLVCGATAAYKFAYDTVHHQTYSRGNPYIEPFYNSTGYWDELMWSAAWMYYATGNNSLITFATDPNLPQNTHAFMVIPDLSVFSWDNKLPGAELLLTRLRIMLNPGYPYEESLMGYHNVTELTMCMSVRKFDTFNWTQVNAPGFYCGPDFFSASSLRSFAKSQVDYVLGNNPKNMSYIVGYGKKYPRHIHHRGASIPHNGIKYSCTGGFKWRDTKKPNPNLLIGAMAPGPDQFDRFIDSRKNYSYTEPTLAGNAGLVAALISLTGTAGSGIDKNTIFSAVPPLFPGTPPPPAAWKP